jgi:hypothetical protein
VAVAVPNAPAYPLSASTTKKKSFSTPTLGIKICDPNLDTSVNVFQKLGLKHAG